MNELISLVPKSMVLELKGNAYDLLDIIMEEPFSSKPSKAEREFFDILKTLSHISPECRRFTDDCISDYNFFQTEKWIEPANQFFYQNRI